MSYIRFVLIFVFSISTIASATDLPQHYCLPQQACWPTTKQWDDLKAQLKGNLVQPLPPTEPCLKNPKSVACSFALKRMHNPFYMQSQPGFNESQGWLGAWTATPSVYAVEARDASDIQAAVNFARQHHLRLAIKGAGHDYLGRNDAPNSLLIWTHKMNRVLYRKSFVPEGCQVIKKNESRAITVSAGSRWLDAYTVATTQHHQYVQGGGCTTVGAAGGFTQGSGFGSWSKEFGTGAAGVLQAKIVTADGQLITANRCQHQDLLWAVRGGGGGTFGVVTQMTLKLHPLPKYFGIVSGEITAKTEAADQQLIRHFLVFFRDHLNNQHWGEKINFTPQNHIQFGVVYQGISEEQALQVWKPLQAFVAKHHTLYTMKIKVMAIPPTKMWDTAFWKKHHADFIKLNRLQGAPKDQYWWGGDSEQASAFWYAYDSWWLPARLLSDDKIDHTAELFYQASRHFSVSLHINKGLAGASQAAIASTQETSINPAVFHAVGLIIMAAASNSVYPGVIGREPDQVKAQHIQEQIGKAIQLFERAAPEAGTYANEANYFQQDWQKAFWGDNYAKLARIKQHYDPQGLFRCHHCIVGTGNNV